MEEHLVTVKSVEFVTHDVLGIKVSKPAGYNFIPGQATEIAINKPGWRDARRPFTFTNLPEEDHLEFTIKTYPEKQGVTNELLHLKANDELLLHDVFGAINYQGPGLFIAGGAGITPFIAIFRQLQATNQVTGNRLLFANKTRADIIREDWFRDLLGDAFINVLSKEKASGYRHGFIGQELIRENILPEDPHFYLCGPPPMMDAIQKHFERLQINQHAVVLEV
ncbi:MAG: hypothetical protein KDC57_12730 [Saprospiraceae bacterium]|nr:hypothetical protein [Saprospiraceae bacterium]